MTIIKKVAFLVHEPVMYAHYSSVWAAMNKDAFVIVLLGGFSRDGNKSVSGARELIENIQTLGYEYIYLEDLLRSRVKYQYVVSNHCMGGSSVFPTTTSNLKSKLTDFLKQMINTVSRWVGRPNRYVISYFDPYQYIPLQVGIKQIRFMYGADIGEGWSLQSWNEIYDLFLCHGPNDEAALKKRFSGRTAIMGYPRYDEYFKETLDVSNVVKEFGLDPTKKTILWITTTGKGASSIPGFAKPIAGLMEHYNIIARPHPIAFRAEPQDIALLRSLGFKIDSNSLRDMNILYKAVDLVLCDYGGSAFGAIYLGKKLILLNVPGTEDSTYLKNASNFELHDVVPLVGLENFESIHSLIADEKMWDEWATKRDALFSRYFADYRGTSSRKAAEILKNLDSIMWSSRAVSSLE